MPVSFFAIKTVQASTYFASRLKMHGTLPKRESRRRLQITIHSAANLRKAQFFESPSPFAVITVDGKQTQSTTVKENTTCPNWNEIFEFQVVTGSIVSVQVFDQNKFTKRSDQGFLGIAQISTEKLVDLENFFDETCIECPLADSFSPSVAQGTVRVTLRSLPGNKDGTADRLPSSRSFEVLSATEPGDGELPSGWEERVADEGSIYYVDHSTKTTTWVDPRRQQQIHVRNAAVGHDGQSPLTQSMSCSQLGPLPSGWEMRLTESGRLFFLDHRNHRVTWNDPRLLVDGNLPQYKRDFKQKQIFFKSLPSLKQEPGKTTLNITRVNAMVDSFDQVMRKSPAVLRRKLFVKFDGEDGLDYGGLSREFFLLLSRTLFDVGYGLFQPSSGNFYLLQVHPSSGVNPDHLQYFRFIGRILGLAIFHNRFLECFFTPSFYKVLLGKQLGLQDLQQVDEQAHKSLSWLLENAVDDSMELFFAVDCETFDQVVQHELVPGGKALRVTEENKGAYVKAYCRWVLVGRVKEQFEAIRCGLYEIVPFEILRIFDEKELELLLGGLREIDVADWRRYTELRKYRPNDKQIEWFWRCVEQDFDDEHRIRLLQFVTGTSRLPIQGFRELHGSDGPRRFTIEKLGEIDSLPKSHTCFNRLDLPPYSSFDLLRSKLLYAIEETVGFATE